jgi:hypothetical protein
MHYKCLPDYSCRQARGYVASVAKQLFVCIRVICGYKKPGPQGPCFKKLAEVANSQALTPVFYRLYVKNVSLLRNYMILNPNDYCIFRYIQNLILQFIKLIVMKNLLYVIAGLLVVIWFIVFLGFNSSGMVHILLVLAGLIILIRLIFNKKLSGK